MIFETRLSALNISRAKFHLSLWLHVFASPEAAKGLLMAVLAGDIQKPGQKTAAWSKAASVEKNLRAKW